MKKQNETGGLLGRLRLAAGLRIPLYAAGAGYFLVLSVFPALVLLLSLLRYTPLAVEDLVGLIAGVIPAALEETAAALVIQAYENSSGATVGLSAVTAMWSAGRGVYGLMTGLNAMYGAAETRSWLAKRLICMAYTFAFFLVLLLTLVLLVFGNTVLKLLPARLGRFAAYLARSASIRFLLLMLLQTLLFDVIFLALPNRRTGFRENLPGALLASAGWLSFSNLYSVYVENFAGLSNVYGSVYAVALSMLWLYCCLSILFYGGALNRRLQESNGKG